jgi:hypothetical protein
MDRCRRLALRVPTPDVETHPHKRRWLATEQTVTDKPKKRRIPLGTIIILILVAIAGIAYYLGSPEIQPSATPILGACTNAVQIVIPDGLSANGSAKPYQPPSLNVVVGVNNTIAWVDDYPGIELTVYSVVVPSGALQWDLNMTDSPGANTQCIALTVLGPYTYVIGARGGVVGTIEVEGSPESSSSSESPRSR